MRPSPAHRSRVPPRQPARCRPADGEPAKPWCRYYFRDKHGFLEALLDDGPWARLVAALGIRATRDGRRGPGAIDALNGVPWLPVLLAQSVYLSDELREQFDAGTTPAARGRAAAGGAAAARRPATTQHWSCCRR
ncbi:MAG: hypothetical protein R2882_12865 [Gemmatimonadales bacterium]